MSTGVNTNVSALERVSAAPEPRLTLKSSSSLTPSVKSLAWALAG